MDNIYFRKEGGYGEYWKDVMESIGGRVWRVYEGGYGEYRREVWRV